MWISPTCARAAPQTIDLLKKHVARAKCEAQGTRWHLISQAEFSERVARARQSRKRQETLVALVTATDTEVLPAEQQHHAQSLSEFASKCKRLRLMEGRAGQK